MKTKEKQLLLKDLCARLPYGVIQVFEDNEYPPCAIIGYDGNDFIDEEGWSHGIGEFKPYLRPMSSMTEEEKNVFDDFCVVDEFVWKGNLEKGYPNQATIMSDGIDWLLSHYFDVRNLIGRGLAIDCTGLNIY